jgi:tRNA (mo5U34)-methyltransferase
MSESDLSQEIRDLGPWFHNLHLPGNFQTAPQHFLGDFPSYKWAELAGRLPSNLRGWKTLDIGCNAGFYSFELARRGADVVALDVDPHYLRQARWAAQQYGLADKIEFRQQQVYELGRSSEVFDLILFMGVFYHLRYPLLALDIVARKARSLVIFQSLSLPGEEVEEATINTPFERREILCEEGWPRMAFIEHKFADDQTNWWVPNHSAILSMLRSSGLEVVSRPGMETYICRPWTELDGTRTPYTESELDAALGPSGT